MPAVLGEVPDASYVIVGEGDDRDRLENLARETGVRDSVVFTGWVDEDELPAYYSSCDVFAMPSRVEKRNGRWTGEGFGIAYIEAAAFGKPVVAGTKLARITVDCSGSRLMGSVPPGTLPRKSGLSELSSVTVS